MKDNKNSFLLRKYRLLWFFGLCLLIIALVETFRFFMNYQILDFGKKVQDRYTLNLIQDFMKS